MTEDVKINIRDEISRYTDDHFMNKLNEELEKVRKSSRFMDNSPISMSNPTSDSEGEDNEGGLEEADLISSIIAESISLKLPETTGIKTFVI